MIRHLLQGGHKFVALFLGAMLSVPAGATPPPQSQSLEAIKARVRELQANRSEARIRLADGSTVQGEIVRMEEDSFTIREKKTGREVTLQFAQTTEIKKKGLSKAIWIPILIGGATLAVFCAAPYPIGFLCRKDPS